MKNRDNFLLINIVSSFCNKIYSWNKLNAHFLQGRFLKVYKITIDKLRPILKNSNQGFCLCVDKINSIFYKLATLFQVF